MCVIISDSFFSSPVKSHILKSMIPEFFSVPLVTATLLFKKNKFTIKKNTKYNLIF